MDITIDESSEFQTPAPFVRGSRLRKSFRIKNRQRYNAKLPPAAIIFMKSLEVKQNSSIHQTLPTTKIEPTNSNVTVISDESEFDFECEDDDVKLIRKQPVHIYRNSFKKLQKKKRFIDFFKRK